ncbi:MAG: RNA methyltransferase [Planctomycetia bacterium]|nr:RNA methyltransferase [Planctomycetia bacterium]
MVERYRRQKKKSKLLGNHQKCWLWGRHAVLETLRAGRWPVLELYVNELLPTADLDFAFDWAAHSDRDERVELIRTTPERLTQLCHSQEHQGFLAKMGSFPWDDVDELLNAAHSGSLFAILDGLQDPHNFGAVIRSAHVLGVDALFVPSQGQVEVSVQVARSSAGAVNHLPIAQADDLLTLATQLQSRGVRLFGASQKAARPLFECDLTGPTAFVVGNEGTGIQPELLATCDELVTIPQFGVVESLNAAVSAGILFYEAQRQRSSRHT